MIGMNDTGPEGDGRNVPFSGGAQVEDKAQGPRRKFRLVRVRNDGRIEEGGRLQGVLGQEIASDQQLSLFGEFLIRQQQAADLFEAFKEQLPNLQVPLGEFSGDFLQEEPDLVFW